KVSPAAAGEPEGQRVGPGGTPLRLASDAEGGDAELPTLDLEALGEDAGADPVEGVILGEALPAGETTERLALAALIERREARTPVTAAATAVAATPGSAHVGAAGGLQEDLAYLLGGPRAPREGSDVEELERKFWALLRIMARKGLLTREELTRELDDAEEPPPQRPPVRRER
ncbi:MAG TPA: hypothetical protein VFO83_14240, partial [Aggregicoccus sp.]|nr:hypothetical protein [Aggregicoccus sp.]